MWFSRKQRSTPSAGQPARPSQVTTKRLGDAAETASLNYLLKTGLALVERNYRTPGRGGGEIDLVMRDKDGTLVFIEVRRRTSSLHGGAAASIDSRKQQRIVFAARSYLRRFNSMPPCRFDVVLVDGHSIEWLRAAFDAC